MSREIKFKAWDHDNDKMIFWTLNDLLVRFGDPKYQFNVEDRPSPLFNWLRYTGLKDKNGKEIYIGDLVKFINPMPIEAKEEIAEVKFVLEDNFLPYIYPFVNISSYNYETKHFEGFGVNSKDCEVVGSIYENPELLEEGE